MTTIATDGRIVAADGLVVDENQVIVDTAFAKLRRLRDGSIVGVAGSAFDTQLIADWLDRDDLAAPFPDVWRETEALLLLAGGGVRFLNEKGQTIAAPAQAATGSGAACALAAMYAGADAFQAVAIAARLDTRTGGVLTFMAPNRG